MEYTTSLNQDQHQKCINILSEAFFEDPIFVWMFPNDSTRLNKLEVFFQSYLRDICKNNSRYLLEATESSLSVVFESENITPNLFSLSRALLTMGPLFSINRLFSALKGLVHLEKLHPNKKHLYLSSLSVMKQSQGKGLGSAQLQKLIELSEKESRPIYLETTNPTNVPYYQNFGFEVQKEYPFAPGAPTVWTMIRD